MIIYLDLYIYIYTVYDSKGLWDRFHDPKPAPLFPSKSVFLKMVQLPTLQGRNDFASSDPHHGIQFIPSDSVSSKSSGTLSPLLFDILSDIPSGMPSKILSGNHIF